MVGASGECGAEATAPAGLLACQSGPGNECVIERSPPAVPIGLTGGPGAPPLAGHECHPGQENAAVVPQGPAGQPPVESAGEVLAVRCT